MSGKTAKKARKVLRSIFGENLNMFKKTVSRLNFWQRFCLAMQVIANNLK